MKDLILDQLLDWPLLSFTELDAVHEQKELELTFKYGKLRCYHSFDDSEFFSYLTKESDNVGVVKKITLEKSIKLDHSELQELARLCDKHFGDSSSSYLLDSSYTVTTLRFTFMDNTTNAFTFLGASNGYYSESLDFDWTDGFFYE